MYTSLITIMNIILEGKFCFTETEWICKTSLSVMLLEGELKKRILEGHIKGDLNGVLEETPKGTSEGNFKNDLEADLFSSSGLVHGWSNC